MHFSFTKTAAAFLLTNSLLAPAQEKSARVPGPAPAAASIDVVGDVDMEMLQGFMAAYRNVQMLDPKKTSGVVDITIASRGGMVNVMRSIFLMQEAMQKNGWTLRCHAVYAMSAAFMIWNRCNERTTFAKSLLMFHFPYYGFVPKVTSEVAKELYDDLVEEEKWFVGELATLPFPSTSVIEQAKQEKMWKGAELCKAAPTYCKVSN